MSARQRRLDPWDRFFDFIEGDGKASVSETEASLREEGLDVDAYVMRVERIVRPHPDWLVRAKRAQAEFEARCRLKAIWLSEKFESARALLEAIGSGEFGKDAQASAYVFFRNHDLREVTEEDLRSFLNDCELLSMLKDESEGV